MINFFANVFGYVLNYIYVFVQNYGLAIILFSILIKLLMLPMSINQQKTMKKNEKVQKEMKTIQLKYKDDPEMLNQEVMALYKREKINPFGGCISIIIQFILLISMFYLVKSPLTYMLKTDKNTINDVKNYIVKEENTSISQGYPEISIVQYVSNNKNKVIEINKDDNKAEDAEKVIENESVAENTEEVIDNENVVEDTDIIENVENTEKTEESKKINLNNLYINMNFLGLDLSKIPQENFEDFKVYIIPFLYVISSFISIKINEFEMRKKIQQNGDSQDKDSTELTRKEDTNAMDQAEMTAQMNKTMSWMMPILAVSISLVAPLGLALYWLLNNIIMIIERVFLIKFFVHEGGEEDA